MNIKQRKITGKPWLLCMLYKLDYSVKQNFLYSLKIDTCLLLLFSQGNDIICYHQKKYFCLIIVSQKALNKNHEIIFQPLLDRRTLLL